MPLWKMFGGHVVVGAGAILLLALVVRYPDLARRPMPPPTILLWVLFGLVTIAMPAFFASVMGKSIQITLVAAISTVAIWLLTNYCLVFIWINTYGT